MHKLSLFVVATLLFISCGQKEKTEGDVSAPATEGEAETVDASSYDPKRGEGKYDKMELAATLDQKMATEGQNVAEVKCTSCHKLTDERLVGPGWKGVTERHTPEWIMNFISNPDPMITKDPKLQAQLEICLVRMPNQGLSDAESRNILEYMRKIDGVK